MPKTIRLSSNGLTSPFIVTGVLDFDLVPNCYITMRTADGECQISLANQFYFLSIEDDKDANL